MLDLTLSTAHVDDAASVVAVAGELDLHTTPRLEREIAAAFADGATFVTVDLTGCEFLDSSALKVLRQATRQRGPLSLVISDRRILRPFEITGFDRFFPIHPTLDGATEVLAHA
jgi:anti-sigma B factor antagonist